MENVSNNTVGDIINLNAVNDASNPKQRETTLSKRQVLQTAKDLDRFVTVTLPDGKVMERIATSPRDIEWSACATLLRDRAMVVSPWRGAEQGKSYKIGKYTFTLPYPIMGIRAAAVREMAFACENVMGTLRLPAEQSGPRRSMTPRDKQDKTKTARNYRTYPVHTDSFVDWFTSLKPKLWLPAKANLRPADSWLVMAETLGPWGKAIDDSWIKTGGEK